MCKKLRRLLGLVVVMVSFSLAILSTPTWAEPAGALPVEEQLKNAVQEFGKKMPNLEPWQKVLLSEEVVPEYQRFIRDYRPSPTGLQIVVDREALARYLTFYAPKFLSQPALQSDFKLLVLLKPPALCPACMEGLEAMKNLVKRRLERRGFTPVWVSSRELPLQGTPDEIEKQIVSKVKPDQQVGGAIGALVVQWFPAPLEDQDTAHPDEKRFLLRSFLKIGDQSFQHVQKDLLDTDRFEVAQARAMTDLLTEVGAKYETQKSTEVEAARAEMLLVVSGIQDFSVYSQMKNFMTTQMSEWASFEERKISRGEVVFSVHTQKGSEELKKKMSEIISGLDRNSLLSVTVQSK